VCTVTDSQSVKIWDIVHSVVLQYSIDSWNAYKSCNIFTLSFLLGNSYHTLGNICPNKRSSYRSIQLFAIVNSNHLKNYGMVRILEVLMDDIRLLEQVYYTQTVQGH
jgi:hypothetical protein